MLAASAAILLAGCGGGSAGGDSARGRAVAEAAGGTLSGTTLDAWLLKAPAPPSKTVGSGFLSAWINTALLIDAVRRNVSLDDAVTVDSVISEDAGRAMIGEFFDARFRKMPAITEKQVDSVLALDRVRVFQQIVFRVKAGADTESIRAVLASARSWATKLGAGGDFTAAVRQVSEDSASRAHDGYLPALTEADLPDNIKAIWNLTAGSLASPLGGRDGFHVVRRATRDESRPIIKAWLAPRIAQHGDSLFIDSLARAHEIVLASDARARLRTMALEPVRLSEGGPLVTWKGGSLSPAKVRQEILMLAPADRVGISDASDAATAKWLIELARREVLLGVVSNEPPPNAATRAVLAPRLRLFIDSLRAVVKRIPTDVSAADAATKYLDSVLVKRAPFLPLPGTLASILRGRSVVTVNREAFDAVVAGARNRWQELHKDDSIPNDRSGGTPLAPAKPLGN